VGHGSLGHRILRQLIHGGADIVSVACHPDDPNEKPFQPSVLDLARDARIPAVALPPGQVPGLPESPPALLISAGYRTILPASFLASTRGFNVHASLLPKYRGRCPLNWALLNGESTTGVTLHEMTGTVDAGRIFDYERLHIGPDTDILTLSLQAEDAAAHLVDNLVSIWAAGLDIPTYPQDESQATYFGRRRPSDGEFSWTWAGFRIHNLVRALTRPWPGAFVRERTGIRYVWKTRLDECGKLTILDDTFIPA